MALEPPLNQIPGLYHFTDTRNLATIRKLGGLYSMARLRELELATFYPGGNQWSLDADTNCGMDQYVHLCFRMNHPMQYYASNDGRIKRTAWLRVKPTVLERNGVLFCPGVSNKAGMTMHPMEEAAAMIDYEVLYTGIKWGDPEFMARLRDAELCEVLVPDFIPFKYFAEGFPNG